MTLSNWTRRPRTVALAAFQRSRGWVRQWVQPILEHVRRRFRLYVSLALIGAAAVGVWSLINFWDWLPIVPDGKESGSTTIRNIGLVIAGLIALPLAIWRSLVAQRQADTAQQSLLNEQYQQGAEMLGSDVLAVRLGGIYALKQLTTEHPEHYHVPVMELLCAFVRHPIASEESEDKPDVDDGPLHKGFSPREDIQAIMRVIGARNKRHLIIEARTQFRIDLHSSDLRGMRLDGANLANAPWRDGVVSSSMDLFMSPNRTDMSGAILCSARLWFAGLVGCKLRGCLPV